METIISSLVSAGVTLIVCLLNNKSQTDKTRTLIEYRLIELEKKVEKHNNLIERTYELEKKADIATAEFRRVNHRLTHLEEDDCK